MNPIILASGSPRRKQLLEWAAIPFEVIVKETDEAYPPDMDIAEVPIHIARNKALAVKAMLEEKGDRERTILAADTVVVQGKDIIGKPRDRDDAVRILSRLAGNEHSVITGVSLMSATVDTGFSDTTHVWFHPLTPAQIEWYVDTYRPFDKAGAYAIQEWVGVVGIRRIEGDFYNVMGLPVSRVYRELQRLETFH